ncbi:MAG: glycine betaine catabolism [Verrucomicrobiota bacterium]|jgi:Rieske 2Fe-2S family protein
MQTTKTISPFRKTAETLAGGAKTLPRRCFVSPEVFADEQKRIFAKQWLLVGHQSQLTDAGDYFVAAVAGPPSIPAPSSAEPGESLILVRDKGGELRAFYNVCRHRGTRLCQGTHGHLPAIQCPYHAWTYGLDGRLLGAPHMDEVPTFAKADYSLHAVNLALWEGFIFVHLAETQDASARLHDATARQAERGGYIPLEEWFAPVAGKFSHWNLPKLRSVKRITYDVRANWKLIFENYSECYHCPGVHPTLSKLTPYDSAENDRCEGPFLGGFMPIMNGKSLTMSGNACALPVGDINVEDFQRVFYYSIFPNMLLSLHPDYVMVHQILPQSAERTMILCDWFFHPDAAGANDSGCRFNPEDAIEFWDMTNKQDWHVCELSQQGIGSRAYEPGPYSSRESIPAAWDDYYLSCMK